MEYKHLKLSETHELSKGDTTCRYEAYYHYDENHQILVEIKIFELKDNIFHYAGCVPLPEHEGRAGFQSNKIGDMRSPAVQVYEAANYCKNHFENNY